MSSRIPWDRYEVALLLNAYERVARGSDINTEAAKLSVVLRNLATYRGILIDETYRNVNGMKMQLGRMSLDRWRSWAGCVCSGMQSKRL